MKGFALLAVAFASGVSPIEKTIQLLEDLEAKVVKDGEAEAKVYEEFQEYCKDTAKETAFDIKTGKSGSERFSASVDDFVAKIGVAETKIGELSDAISSDSADLKSATAIRKKEYKDFMKVDADLGASVDMIERAIGILERELAKTGFMQMDKTVFNKVMTAVQAVIDVSAVTNAADAVKLQALIQASTNEDDELSLSGAPDPAAYKSSSGGIISSLEDMLEKAKAQQSDAQKAEMEAKFNFDMLKQKLEDQIKFANKELDETKKAKAASEEGKAEAEGNLEKSNKGVTEDSKKLKELQTECMTKAEEYEVEMHDREGELEALALAKKILVEKTGGAADRAYSFVQVSMRTSTRAKTQTRAMARLREQRDLVLAQVQRIAKDGSTEMVQLAERLRMASLMSADPFAKIKGMIQEMIEKLVKEAEEEAGHKAYCDKEMGETKVKKADMTEEVEDLQVKIDKATSKIAKLKQDIMTLTQELAKIAEEQQTADKIRAEEKGAWEAAEADFSSGLEGVGMALQVLRDYYAEKEESLLQTGAQTHTRVHAKAKAKDTKESGAASGIIGMLEVVESDFSKLLAEGKAAEDQAIKIYEEQTTENKIATKTKETEIKYKTKDQKETEALLESLKEDIGGSQKELDAINEYWEKLQPECVAKPEPYEERKKRREAEIAGLKDALKILEEESAPEAFLQIRRKIRSA
jgi:hypothetical protein